MALGEGTISIKIVDQERRFNINVADEQILQQGLKLVGVDASAFGGITGAILDWIDAMTTRTWVAWKPISTSA